MIGSHVAVQEADWGVRSQDTEDELANPEQADFDGGVRPGAEPAIRPRMGRLKMLHAAVENEKVGLDTLATQFLAHASGESAVARTHLEHAQRAPARPAEDAGEQVQAAGHAPRYRLCAPGWTGFHPGPAGRCRATPLR